MPEDTNGNCDVSDFKTFDDVLKQGNEILARFFRNEFDKSRELCLKYSKTSMSHAVGLCYHSFVYALFTMERPQIAYSMKCCEEALELLATKRKQSSLRKSLSSWFTATDYNEYTDEEAHAEANWGDVNFIIMVLYFIGDQSLLSIVRGAKRFFQCNAAAKLSREIMENKTNWSTDWVKQNFECAVYQGTGAINLVFSHMPSRVLKLISLVGIGTDRALGLDFMRRATEMYDIFRSKSASFVICFYSFYLEQFFGLGEADLPWVTTITEEGLKRYPNGAFDLFFSARLQQIKGNTAEAIQLFERSIDVQKEFVQMHNVCRWDLIWCYAINRDWKKAAEIADLLLESCQWSPATNAYQKACFLYMFMEETGDKSLMAEVDKAMRSVPELRVRYGGKTLPPEKFAITQAERYMKEPQTPLVLPAMPLFYIWNIFGNCSRRPELLRPHIDMINQKLKDVLHGSDDYYLLLLMKGICLRVVQDYEQAIESFAEVMHNQDSIEEINWIPANTALELGITYLHCKENDNAKKWLEKARDEYTGYLAESLAHLRIHGALQKIKAMKNR